MNNNCKTVVGRSHKIEGAYLDRSVLSCFFWEPRSMGGYEPGTRKPIKHPSLWMNKA